MPVDEWMLSYMVEMRNIQDKKLSDRKFYKKKKKYLQLGCSKAIKAIFK